MVSRCTHLVPTDKASCNPHVFIIDPLGEEWENAWNSHIKDWKPPCEISELCFKSTKIVVGMNGDRFNPSYHNWTDEHFTVCHLDYMVANETILLIREDSSPPKDLARFGTALNSFQDISWEDVGFTLAQIHSIVFRPCRILGYKEGLDFDVVYFAIDGDQRILRRNRSLPPVAIEFVHKPYQSDMYWSGAFRHSIGIPDDIFPSLWKDMM